MYRSCKDGYETYMKWKYDWSTNGQREASIKVKKKAVGTPCSIHEDERVSVVNHAEWLDSLTEPSSTSEQSQLDSSLHRIFPDGVGLSPTLNNWMNKAEDSTGYVKLFTIQDNSQTAFAFRPDIMEPDGNKKHSQKYAR
ncbi:Lysine-specific histone demethylase 1B [Desmophyllum pertusum]|uniref:Lysine-specific histone demethylase 1B n=1 Tax=Desmophyllum pertusum TaxID=174260 RepID=A0A9W9YKD2_9CNID|nr:Lysine-specific histone demethylase 1B [Desmophyllum pertusum]